ncbi:MAG: hypothetical protein GXC72_10470 [Chitinophagaceae bacterium]|nr:hypothetical protein [Chitinophagaceae bacterium]
MSNRIFYGLLACCGLVYLLAMWLIPVIDIDAAQYASISREMLDNGSYLKVYDMQRDYLDKPPLLFWLSSQSMRFFGINHFAYRLPSVILLLTAIYATYRFASLYYEKLVAQLSALVLATSQAVFLVVHDVRCDTMLMGWVMLSLWQLAAWYETRQWKHFFMAFTAVAAGMMTKGPIALMVPVFAFVPHFALRREWKQFFRWEYIPGLVWVALLLLPMSIGLYQQYDLEPGKIFNGVPIQSGLRFYYWTQSFGRYTGENVYHEMSHFTFLLENMFWSFLPWILCLLAGLYFGIKLIVQKRFHLSQTEEGISIGGFLITYCILARSQAQLPHYIFVVFPLAAIITARFLHRVWYTNTLQGWRKPLMVFHTAIFALLWLVVVVLMKWPFPDLSVLFTVAAVGGLGLFVYLLVRPSVQWPNFIRLACYTAIGVNLFLATGFYPRLLQYQLGNTAAAAIDALHLDKNKVVQYDIDESRALHFYGKHIFARAQDSSELRSDQVVLTRMSALPQLEARFPAMKIIFEGNYYGVSMLSLPFLNPETRSAETQAYALVDLDGGK